MRALPPTGAHRRKHLAPTHHKQRRRRHGRPQREGRTDRRDLQRLRLHRRAAGRVHQRAPERHDRAQQGRDQQRRARQLLPEARQDRPRRHRSDRDRLDARGHEVLRPARARARRPEGPLARLEGEGGHRLRGEPHRLRHRHRPRGRLLPLRPVRRGGPSDRSRRGREAAAGRLGELLQGRRRLHRQDRQGVLRLGRRHLPGHDQPGRGGLREPRLRQDRHLARRREDLQRGARRERHPVGTPRPVVG